jgi:excisionase family DNA binding protein
MDKGVRGVAAMTEREVLDVREAAEFLRLSVYTVRKYAKRGTLPAKKTGRDWLFVKADLLTWLRTKDPPQEGP